MEKNVAPYLSEYNHVKAMLKYIMIPSPPPPLHLFLHC